MPTINQSFTLTVTPEQFINACSDSEIMELDLLLCKRIREIVPTENMTITPVSVSPLYTPAPGINLSDELKPSDSL